MNCLHPQGRWVATVVQAEEETVVASQEEAVCQPVADRDHQLTSAGADAQLRSAATVQDQQAAAGVRRVDHFPVGGYEALRFQIVPVSLPRGPVKPVQASALGGHIDVLIRNGRLT